MENVSRITDPKRHPLEIKIYPYLYSHHLEGKALYPAVETLILLARAVRTEFPQITLTCLTDAFFPRFLSIPDGVDFLTASVDIGVGKEGKITAALLSVIKSKTGNISRTVEHARVNFGGTAEDQLPVNPFPAHEKLEGECINVPAAAIYRDLVPFGKEYQNIRNDLCLSSAGAVGKIYGGDTEADDELLGSPFPFDAALQMACVWAQRFADVVPFPVGFAKRAIYQKTKKRAAYLGRIIPVEVSRKTLIVNAWIFDQQGSVCEVISGIQMTDVSGGRLRPSEWIKVATI